MPEGKKRLRAHSARLLTARQRLLAFIVLAFIVDYIPLLNLPFLWSQTFFHEISHGLTALLTGGSIHNIHLSFNGSGTCTTSGGWLFLITFTGYAGSALWGMFVYRAADTLSGNSAKIMTWLMLSMLIITLVLWARDISTIIILLILLLMYATLLRKTLWFNITYFLQLVGVFVLLEAIRSPLYLLDGRDLGDGASLAEQTFLPEFFWVVIWFGIALACLYQLWKASDEKIASTHFS